VCARVRLLRVWLTLCVHFAGMKAVEAAAARAYRAGKAFIAHVCMASGRWLLGDGRGDACPQPTLTLCVKDKNAAAAARKLVAVGDEGAVIGNSGESHFLLHLRAPR